MLEREIKVLLIDDDEDEHVLTRDLLAEIVSERYRLDWQPDYEAALRSLHTQTHDVYLLDYQLGERNGLELLKQAVDGGCRAPVIMLTGLDDREVDLQAMRLGAADYLAKGKVDAPLLERSIRYALAQARTLEALRESEERSKGYDSLTGLPNRVLFLDRLGSALRRAQRQPAQEIAVLFLDLDRFKLVNDSLGNSSGNQLLIEVARRLAGCVGEGDTIARLGGDEFAILLEPIRDASDATRAAARIHEALSAACELDGRQVFTSASVGIAFSAGGHAEKILQDSDTAMYRAKSLGPGRTEVFDETMRAWAQARLRMENDLRWSLEREQLDVCYQPIVSLDHGGLLGFEALARWDHPEHGSVPPERFIPIAEETGMILALGALVLRRACRQMRVWMESSPPDEEPLLVSVNVSGKQLAYSGFPDLVADVLRETGLPPRGLRLEITESAIVENADSAAEILRKLREMGVGIWLDDFGTGHASFSYLYRFPIEALKIDRSFIQQLDESSTGANGGNGGTSSEITRTIVLLAHSLGLSVVGEGVESFEQRDQLREFGCDSVQGFLFSPPLPAAAAAMLLSTRRRLPHAAASGHERTSRTMA